MTTHHIMPYFLERTMGGMSIQKFFDHVGLDPILWVVAHRADRSRGEYFLPDPKRHDAQDSLFLCSENWIIESENLTGTKNFSVRFRCVTPRRTLSMVLEGDEKTSWVTERLIKEKSDIEIFAQYAPVPLCDADAVNREADSFGSLFRGRHRPPQGFRR